MLRFPKPHGERAKLVCPQEQETANFILRMLAGADVLDLETTNELGFTNRWLLVAVGHAELDFLAAFRAEREDLEDNADAEPDVDDEPDDEDEEHDGREPDNEGGHSLDDLSQWRRV